MFPQSDVAARRWRWRAMVLAAVLLLAALVYGLHEGRPVMAQTTIDFPLSCSGSTPFEFGGITITKTDPGVSTFSFLFTVSDPSGTRTETFPPATLNLGESASPFFSGDNDDNILTLTITVNNGGQFSTSNFQNFCSDVQGGGPFGGLSVSFARMCPIDEPLNPFEVGTVDVTNVDPLDRAVTFDFEWRIGNEHHRDSATLAADDTETFRACDLIGNASSDVVVFRIVAISSPHGPSDLLIDQNNVVDRCQSVPCDSLGSATACDLLRKTWPAQRQTGKQEAVTATLIRKSTAGTITVNANWNATNVSGQPVTVQACTDSTPTQCGQITITKKRTKLQRFEFPPFPDCSQGSVGGIDSLCVASVDAPPDSISASYSRYTTRDPCQ